MLSTQNIKYNNSISNSKSFLSNYYMYLNKKNKQLFLSSTKTKKDKKQKKWWKQSSKYPRWWINLWK